jgi:hypothetical protein
MTEAPKNVFVKMTEDYESNWWGVVTHPYDEDGVEYVRADLVEAKLAKAVQALDRIAGKAPYADDPYDIARAALAELEGDKT